MDFSYLSSSKARFFLGGGWVSNHIRSFTQPTPSQKLLPNCKPRDNNDVTDWWIWFFIVLHTSRRQFPSVLECRHRDATMASPLELNYRILPENGFLIGYSRPTVTRRKGKKTRTVAFHTLGNSFDIIEARQ